MVLLNFADPKLSSLKSDCHALQLNALAPSTIRARKGQWLCYTRFCSEFKLKTLPCSNRQLTWFVTYLEKYMTYTSTINYIQAVILVHKLRNLDPPSVSSHSVKLTLQGVKRRSEPNPSTRDPITVDILLKMYDCLNLSIKVHVLFWASALLLFRSLLRVSHVIDSPHTLNCSDIIWVEDGYDIRVRSSKTSTVLRVVPVREIKTKKLCSVFWLKRWFSIIKVKGSVPLFSMSGHKAVSYTNYSTMLSKVVASAGLKYKISTHSFRHGGASFLSSLGVPITKIKDRGGWKSNAVYHYISENFNEKVRREKFVAAAIDLNC